MLASFMAWITDALDRGLDVRFRVMPASGGAGRAVRDGDPVPPRARGSGVFVWDVGVTDLSGEPLANWPWPDAGRAQGGAPTDESGRAPP